MTAWYSLDPWTALAIGGMALATYLTRIAGAALLAAYRPGRITKGALDAVPVAILTAVIAPGLVAGGAPDLIAGAITVAAAFRLPLLVSVSIGVVCVVGLRALLG